MGSYAFWIISLICILASFLPLTVAHDVEQTATAVCTNGPSGYGPYVSWRLRNDWRPCSCTLTMKVATSLGPVGTQLTLGPRDSSTEAKSGVLQAWTPVTRISASVVWCDQTQDGWNKAATLSAPTGCTACTLSGSLCGSQTGMPVCQAMQCGAGTNCVQSNLASDARCPVKQGVAGGMPICQQQACVNGACSTTNYFDPACVASALPAGVSSDVRIPLSDSSHNRVFS